MDLLNLYSSVNEILSRLDFGKLHPGFRKYKFALYTGAEVCLGGAMIPYDERFCGNTSIEYNGEHIAIWDMDYETDVDVEMLAYDMVHEMYHCFQNEHKERRFPDELKLLNYPADLKNYAEKHQENVWLAKAFSGGDEAALKRFFEIRNSRFDNCREYICEEFKVETIEGMAEYVGLKALAAINSAKYQRVIADYIHKLKYDIPLLFDIRRVSYYTGSILYLTLDKLGFSLCNSPDGPTAYEQNMLYSGRACAGCDYPEVRKMYKDITARREATIAEHIATRNYVTYAAKICGYDPMNMFRHGDLIFCSHFIFLQGPAGSINIPGPVLLKLKEGSDSKIVGYY